MTGKVSNNQKGFTAVEGLILLFILIIIGAVGYMVYHDDHKTKTATVSTTAAKTSTATSSKTQKQATTKTYTDSSKTYTLSYPTSWTESEQGTGDLVGVTYNLLDTTSGIFIPPNTSPISTNPSVPNSIHVTAFKTTDIKGLLSQYVTGDGNTTPQQLTINGYQAYYQKDTSTSSSNGYTDDDYAVTNNGVSVVFQFRVQQDAISYSASPKDNVPAFNDSNVVPAFTSFVKSIKFLN
ncbi:MAG TPA: hypothetical protein VFN51_01390 [Candidatus Saccharimonadales bacterium]|nr:hypothetical protein [Candidatus Saccharimonadales bacterium]